MDITEEDLPLIHWWQTVPQDGDSTRDSKLVTCGVCKTLNESLFNG